MIRAMLLLAALAATHPRDGLSYRTIFEGVVHTRTAAGGTRAVPVTILLWSVDRASTEIPSHGLLLAHLRGGELVTVIDGTRVRRFEGEIWTVPRGQTMTIETKGDSVVLQTTEIGE